MFDFEIADTQIVLVVLPVFVWNWRLEIAKCIHPELNKHCYGSKFKVFTLKFELNKMDKTQKHVKYTRG